MASRCLSILFAMFSRYCSIVISRVSECDSSAVHSSVDIILLRKKYIAHTSNIKVPLRTLRKLKSLRLRLLNPMHVWYLGYPVGPDYLVVVLFKILPDFQRIILPDFHRIILPDFLIIGKPGVPVSDRAGGRLQEVLLGHQ